MAGSGMTGIASTDAFDTEIVTEKEGARYRLRLTPTIKADAPKAKTATIPSNAKIRWTCPAHREVHPCGRSSSISLNAAMKNLTQRRKGAKTRGFGSLRTPEFVHPAGELYVTAHPFA